MPNSVDVEYSLLSSVDAYGISFVRHVEEAFTMSESIASKYGFSLNVHVYNNLMQGCIQARRNSCG
eukprot:2543734-Amphidinium_carterae.1